MGRFELVSRKREAKYHETRDGDSDSEACYNNKRQRIDESIFTSTGCARMFEQDIIHDRAKELGNTKLNKKLYQLKELGVGSKLLERMRWEGGALGKYGQGMFLPIKVNTRPANNVIVSQEPENEEDEALSRPMKKKKTYHDFATKDDFCLVEKEENNDDLKRKQVDGLEVITGVINQLNNEFCSGTLSLELLGNSFMYMKSWFPDEYKLYGLSTIACSFALPLLFRLFEGWDPLIKPADHTDIISVWKDLLQGDEIDSPYVNLFMEVVLCAFMRSNSINAWQAKHPETLLRFLYSWEGLLPYAALERILCQIVMPKLLAAVNSWNPHTDSSPMHIWVHPWLPLLGDQKHSISCHTVRTKLEGVLNAWHPSDVSAYTILSPWMSVFDPETWEQIMVRYISPKLLSVMHEFQVNPADQKLDHFYWVRKWVNVIPNHHMLQIMTVFVNKWLQVLYHWLCSKPIIREVSYWYLSWHYLIPFEILSNEHIRGGLNMGLDMMNKAIGQK